jgi:hypothetical protein
MPGAKPHKVKKPKKMTTPEAVTAKRLETVKPAPVLPVLPKYTMFPVPAFDGAIDSFERSCEAAGQGAQAFNAKFIDMARSNVTSGFDFMANLTTVKHPSEAIRLQMSYWESCMRTLIGQGRELQMLSAAIVTKANEPIRAHLAQSLKAA